MMPRYRAHHIVQMLELTYRGRISKIERSSRWNDAAGDSRDCGSIVVTTCANPTAVLLTSVMGNTYSCTDVLRRRELTPRVGAKLDGFSTFCSQKTS
jgi:hypothetical protein